MHLGDMLTYWKRHPKPELEAVLGEYHEAKWEIVDPVKGGQYYRVKCPCGKHQRWIHLTPSNPRYAKNCIKWLYRQECYGKDAGDE